MYQSSSKITCVDFVNLMTVHGCRLRLSRRKLGHACDRIGGGVRDMNINGVTRIVKISICHGHAIDAITVGFLRNGREESTKRWGGPRGGLTEVPPFCIPILTDSGNFYFLVKQIGHIDPLRDNNITRRSVKHNMFVEN